MSDSTIAPSTTETPNTGSVSRRDFLVRTASGLAIGLFLSEFTRIDEVEAAAASTQVNTWLCIGTDDSVTLTIGSSDMGQGSFSALAQVLAEELIVDYARVTVGQGYPTAVASPWTPALPINTVGSGVMRNNFWKMRDAGAIARETLVMAAMGQIGDAARGNYTVANGVITHVPSGQTRTYGAVAAAAALLTPPASAPLVPDGQFRLIGKTMPRFDIPLKVDGSAKYGLDIQLPGMVYAIIKHCPTFGGTLAVQPTVPAGMIGVVPVYVAPGLNRGANATNNYNAVAVVGTNTWDTWQAAKKLTVKWVLPTNASTLNSSKFFSDGQALSLSATPYVAGGTNPAGTLYTVEGDPVVTANDLASPANAKVLDATYTLPYVPHACMEVLNCTVDYVPGVKCDVYAPTQSAKSVMTLVVNLTRLAPGQVRIFTTYLGGGLGRKSEADFVSQAVQVGMALGRPVKLMWPREEDFTQDQYRPMAVIRARAGLDASGGVRAWAYRNVSPSLFAQRGIPLGAKGDSQGIEGANSLPYNFGSRLTEYVTHPSPIPVGFWRSVGASLNTFAVESMIDELAFAAGNKDPYEYRRALLTDPRWVAVLDAAAAAGNWYTKPAAGRFRGIAIGTAFNSIVAEVVEISSVTTSSLKVERVAIALDCYMAVNPGSIDAQLVGGMVHGLNAALYGRQTFVNGVAQAKNFTNSRMIRLQEMPLVSVKLIANPGIADRAALIGGVGELGVPTLAPALANAYFKATGLRVRTLPFFPTATMGGL